MKQKSIFVITIIFCLLLLPACNNNSQEEQITNGNNQTSIEQSEVNTGTEGETNEALIANLRKKAYVDYDRKYIDIVENLQYGSEIVGSEATKKWVDEVLLKQNPGGQFELPGLYQMIKYFSIPREDFIELNNSYIDRGIDWGVIPDDVLNGLYAEDENSMKQMLVSPYAIYHDGMIYTVNELRQMSSDQIRAIGIPSDELRNYTNIIEIVIRASEDYKLYDLNYKDFINTLKEISAE